MHSTQQKPYHEASAGRVFLIHATALKAMYKAGRRGGDSIAREGPYMFLMHVQG